MSDTLSVDPSLKEMFDNACVVQPQSKPAANQAQYDVTPKSQKVDGINTERSSTQDIDSAGECVAAQNSIGILGECMSAAGKLTDECVSVVKPQLPIIQTTQVMANNTIAANNMSWTHKMDMTPT